VKAPVLPSIDFRAILRDFQNLNPRDVGAWPVVPRVSVLVGVLLLILLAGWFLVWVDQLEALQAKQRTELNLREEFVVKKKQAVNLDLYIQQLNEIDRSCFVTYQNRGMSAGRVRIAIYLDTTISLFDILPDHTN